MARAWGDVSLDDSEGSGEGSAVRRPADALAQSGAVPIDYVTFGDGESGERMALVQRPAGLRVLGRYLVGDQIAAGGMASVHLGRLVGAGGFSRTVAVKRLHSHLARNPSFVQRFIDEARIVSRIRHANVVQTLDIVTDDGELLLVLDYVHGESLAKLRRSSLAQGAPVPPRIASAIVIGVLRGLHAAHEAKSASGSPLGCVHRDISPQNVLVGADGVARVLDFGIAKAAGRLAESLTRNVKGKLAYMSPQQIGGDDIDRRTDVFAAGVVLWEAIAGERLFRGDDAASTIHAVYHKEVPPLATRAGLGVTAAADAVLAQALAKTVDDRFDTADAMARALEIAIPPAHEREVADWVDRVGREALTARATKVSAFERMEVEGDRETASALARRSVEAHPLPLRTMPARAPAPVDLDKTFEPPAKRQRRDALVPPPMMEDLPSVVVAGLDASNDTAPQLAPPISRHDTAVPRSHTMPVRGSSSFMATRHHTEPVPRPNPTPMVMMFTPPTPMPMAIPSEGPRPTPAKAPRGGVSAMHLALLVVVPPIAVAAAVLGLRLETRGTTHARASAGSTAAPMVVAATAPPPIAPLAPPPVATAPPPIATTDTAASGTTPATAAHATPGASGSAPALRAATPKRPTRPPGAKAGSSGIPRERR